MALICCFKRLRHLRARSCHVQPAFLTAAAQLAAKRFYERSAFGVRTQIPAQTPIPNVDAAHAYARNATTTRYYLCAGAFKVRETT